MPVRAAGLRQSAAGHRRGTPWPCAANPAAMAIAKPEVIATQLVDLALAPSGTTPTARTENIIITNNNITIFRIFRQWVAPVGG
jgi:hypothetical protein